MGFETRPDVGNERRVFRDLGRQRVDPPRGVQELPFSAGNRPNADENVADPEEAAERFTIQGVPEVRRLRSGDQLSSDPCATAIGVPSFFMSAAAVKPNVLERELKYSLN